jgi:hypothetical protein
VYAIENAAAYILFSSYLNVLPADVMARMGAETIIAVDVAPHEASSGLAGVSYVLCEPTLLGLPI